MKITNITNKNITLCNGKLVKIRQTVDVEAERGTALYEQIKNLEKKGLLMIRR